MVSLWYASKYRVHDPKSKYGFFGAFSGLEQIVFFAVGFANVAIDINVVDINENCTENIIIYKFLTAPPSVSYH